MIHVKRILYATDFSPHSNQAYFHAIALAEGHGASLTILHVCKLSPVITGDAMIPALGVNPQDADYWRLQLEQIRPTNPKIEVHHVLLQGSAAEEIIRYATHQGVDLIVLGTHGRTGLERLLMGSVAEQVVRGAPCSVLVVKMPKGVPATQEHKAAEELSPASSIHGASQPV